MSANNTSLVRNLLHLQTIKQAEQLLTYARDIRAGHMPDPGTANMLALVAKAMVETIDQERAEANDHA